PPLAGQAPIAVAVIVHDPSGRTALLSFQVSAVADAAPTWPSSLPAIVGTAGSPINYLPPAASDTDAGDTLTYSAPNGLPAGLSLDPATGRITGTSNNVVSNFAITLRATDSKGAFVERQVLLTLVNAPPVYVGGLNNHQYDSGDGWQDITLGSGTFRDPNHDA